MCACMCEVEQVCAQNMNVDEHAVMPVGMDMDADMGMNVSVGHRDEEEREKAREMGSARLSGKRSGADRR